jgi:TonB-dependent SusC/RagA subfamily outer membrane receptor
MKREILILFLLISLKGLGQADIFKGYGCPETKTPASLNLKRMPGEENILNPSKITNSETSFVIRCSATLLSFNEPLYIVDGVPFEIKEFKDIKPNEIISIEILKPSTAAALFGCRASTGVIIITTKKANQKTFSIKDAKDRIGIGYATVTAVSQKTGKSFSFIANEFGKIQTDSLKSSDYQISVSCIGYKTKEVPLKNIAGNRYEVYLEKEIMNLKEVVVSGLRTNTYRKTVTECYSSMLICKVPGIQITMKEEIQNHSGFLNSGTIKAYPNPVTPSGTISLSFSDVKPGQYLIRIINESGQLFCRYQKQISAKAETEQIHLSSSINAGIYFVQVINEQKKLVQSSKVVVQ